MKKIGILLSLVALCAMPMSVAANSPPDVDIGVTKVDALVVNYEFMFVETPQISDAVLTTAVGESKVFQEAVSAIYPVCILSVKIADSQEPVTWRQEGYLSTYNIKTKTTWIKDNLHLKNCCIRQCLRNTAGSPA